MNGPTITKNLTFIDETLQFRSGVAKSEGHVAKKRLANSLDTSSASSSKRVTQLNSPALSHRHKTDKSFTKLEKLDMGFNLLLTCQTGQLGTTSPTTWIPCFDAAGRTDGPLTPATSSHSDEFIQKSNWVDFKSLGSPESWLSGNGESEDSSTQSGCLWEKPSVHGLQATLRNSTVYPREDGVLYGYDVGAADKDWLKSEDESANLLSTASDSSGHGVVNFGGEGISRRKHDRAGAVISHYYDSAVPVIIPWTFEPLPDILKRNQVNLMYFHHFLDHSAQVLVPYHDADTNPIGARIVQMALNNDALMSLILAYSASHRSQLLRADLPQMRMAEWAQSVFPALREPLVNEPAPVSDVALSMAVMLVALEIMSPGAFGQGISWREHITHARALFAKRLEHASKEPSGSNDDEGFKFIENWLGHVFVMGSLMAGPRLDSVCTPHVRFTLSDSYSCGEDSDEINCMTGISLKCASLLGRVAELTKQCQGERFRLDGRLLRGWSPEAAVTEQAILLEKQMMESFRQSSRPCSHVRMGNIHMQDLTEIAAINEAFHAAGLIHLHQRVLGSPVDHAEVQSQVQKIIQCLDQLRIGAAAEIRCLFPMFTAGCAAIDENQQAKILGRLMSAEKSGMKQVGQSCKTNALGRELKVANSWPSLLDLLCQIAA
ncbi:hypothetical protein QQS21_012788 [Conoideocrella luteorostrata]|uniref:Uncharacterized protein n=1 Tax=Conoideocrella luteorostrata TaxID=1105319 RepID=A0AAJ0CF32_9HYPO|nr:hypothetical protein QQS21_012788 [Conoideocrella luteorostrata]